VPGSISIVRKLKGVVKRRQRAVSFGLWHFQKNKAGGSVYDRTGPLFVSLTQVINNSDSSMESLFAILKNEQV
jgi:hypothetical protein